MRAKETHWNDTSQSREVVTPENYCYMHVGSALTLAFPCPLLKLLVYYHTIEHPSEHWTCYISNLPLWY